MRKPHRRIAAALFALSCLIQVCAIPGSASATVTASSCGAAVYKSSGALWQCTFDDEFTGTTLDLSKWQPVTTAESGYHSGVECFENSPTNIGEANGYLRLTVVQLANYFNCRAPMSLFGGYGTRDTSGMVTAKFAQRTGRFAVRALFPSTKIQGLQSALWLYPVNPSKYGSWPNSGEIDLAENYSLYSDLAIPTLHYTPLGVDPNTTNNACTITPGVFHTYVLEWTTYTMRFIYDGKVCLSDTWHPGLGLTSPAPFDQPFLLSLTQSLGVYGNGFTYNTPLPASTYIDYVRIWK
jgi:beta-glucanase (GH16 family)